MRRELSHIASFPLRFPPKDHEIGLGHGLFLSHVFDAMLSACLQEAI